MPRLKLFFPSLLALLLMTGCVPHGATNKEEPRAQTAPAPVQWSPEDVLPTSGAPSPKSNSIGLVVFNPVVAKGNPPLANFAAGCGFYLRDAVAGAPELGQTPLRTTVYNTARARRKEGEEVLAPVDIDDATAITRVSGATHFAVATLQETTGQIVLAYKLYHVNPSLHKPEAIGKAIEITASDQSKLISELPSIADKMRHALAVAGRKAADVATYAPPVLLSGMTAETLAKIGEASIAEKYTDEQSEFLKSAGETQPLATQMALFIPAVKSDVVLAAPYVELLIKTAPGNTQILGDIALVAADPLSEDAKAIHSLAVQYPDSYLLAYTEVMLLRLQKSAAKEELAWGEKVVQNAPANADAHLTISSVYNRASEDIRHGRYYSVMNFVEKAQLKPLYRDALNQAEAATRCDPLNAKAWNRLSGAAAFVSNEATAQYAFDKSEKLLDTPAGNISAAEVYSWGLDLFSRKWENAPNKLDQVAARTINANYASNDDKIKIINYLRSSQLSQHYFETFTERLFQESTAQIQKNPKNAEAHELHGYLLDDRKDWREGSEDYEANVRIQPDYWKRHLQLGMHYGEMNRVVRAEAAFRKADKLNPNDAHILALLGWAIKSQGQWSEAEKYFKKSLVIKPNNVEALPRLATIYVIQKKYAEAIPMYEETLRQSPYHEEASVNLVASYEKLNRFEDAIRVGEDYLRRYPGQQNIQDSVAIAYNHVKRYSDAEKISRDCLSSNAKDMDCHTNLGEALAHQGKVPEARQEWELAVRSTDDPETRAKAQQLLKQFP